MKKFLKGSLIGALAMAVSLSMMGCGSKGNEQVVIYSNADEEALQIMEEALNAKGYEGKYILQGMGTSELGGKLTAEGKKIEADIVTMSSYFIESAQKQHDMFADLTFETAALTDTPAYYTPILANTGAMFVNTEVMKAEGLELPTSIKDLTKPEYAGLVSIPNVMDSSTAWLLIQAIIETYGETEGAEVVKALTQNCGPHIESSGSGPIKKVRAGEVAVGFGLRHQAVADQESGKPIAFIDPVEGNFSLTEAVAVVKKDEAKTKLAMEMAQVIVEDGRKGLIEQYPVALYEGEEVESIHTPLYPKQFASPLTVELLEAHQAFFAQAKAN